MEKLYQFRNEICRTHRWCYRLEEAELGAASFSSLSYLSHYFKSEYAVNYFSFHDRAVLKEAPYARSAVKNLQQFLGETGAFDRAQAALQQPDSPFRADLMMVKGRGEGGRAFSNSLQHFDDTKGLFATPDGDYGHSTRLAVAFVQWEMGLSVDGGFGPSLMQALEKKYALEKTTQELKEAALQRMEVPKAKPPLPAEMLRRPEEPEVIEIKVSDLPALIDEPPSQGFVIYRVTDAKKPTIRHPYEGDKEYIILHGSSGSDADFIVSGAKSGDFAYGILSNGRVLQFFDDALGTGAAGPFSMIEGDALANNRAIAVELSLPPHAEILYEVADPNEAQIRSTKQLTDWLIAKYHLGLYQVSLSSQTVVRDGHQVDGTHGDTYTWRNRPELLESLGVAPEALLMHDSLPDLATVKEKIALAKRQMQDYPEYADRLKDVIKHWQKVLEGPH